jgi:hypothetical protein
MSAGHARRGDRKAGKNPSEHEDDHEEENTE